MKKQIIYITMLLLGLQLQAQTVLSDKNYIHSTTPQSPLTEEQLNSIDNTTLEDSKKNIEQVTYFDGLGRPIQQTSIRGGVSTTDVRTNNELLMDWTEGEGSTPFYNQNGDTSENIRTMGLDPFGKQSLLWFCNNDVKNDADGGWNTDYFNIDKNIAYRYTVWVKRAIAQSGTTYHGTQNVNDLDGNADTNPYFWYGHLPQIDTWYLLVGVIHPQNYTGQDQGISGVYDTEGNKVIDGKEFKWMDDSSTSRFRSYLYYSIDNNSKQYFWNPIVQKLDGSENVLQDFINPNVIGIPKDIVTHIEYDKYGRQSKNYLPFPSNEESGIYKFVNVNLDINQYYKNTYPDDFIGIDVNHKDFNAYSQSVFEKSPLNRVLERGAPGKSWKVDTLSDNDHTIKFDWNTNRTDDKVVYFKVNFANPGNTEVPNLVRDGYYAANQLHVTITKDENWISADGNNHTTKEYINKRGRVILKRTYNSGIAHDTHYIYDIYDNLTYVLSPKVNVADGVSEIELAELCYQYRYDDRNRLIEKKVPGKDWEYIVYNKLNQPILTQDASLRKENSGKAWDQWLFTKYDAFGRVAYTGSMINGSTRKVLQGRANDSTDPLHEARISSPIAIAGTTTYYSLNTYPNRGLYKVYMINYYDDYGFDTTSISLPATIGFGQEIINHDNNNMVKTKGLVTGNKVRILDTNNWTTTLTGYDKKARAIYVASKNEYLNTTDIVETQLDFVGKVEKTKSTHIKDNHAAIVTIDTFTYDHMGRMLTQTQKINNQVSEVIASHTYDGLGQLKNKKVGGGLQDVKYAYNIRGWLKEINDVANLGDDLFAFKLNYTKTEGTSASSDNLYNGNITQTIWRTAQDNIKRSYTYKYDALNRIKSSRYLYGDDLLAESSNIFEIHGISYDPNGNITSLSRYGLSGSGNPANPNFKVLDRLTYDYGVKNTNQLVSVTDSGDKTKGFIDRNTTGADYEYDSNGNMTIDRNKGITSITYNHLNSPKTVTVNNTDHTGNITYIYNATGAKLKKIATEGGSLITEYAGNYVYKNGILEFFNHPEGIVEKEADGYKYVYQYKDHLGNIRLSYTDRDKDGKIDVVRNNTDIDGDNDNIHEIKEVKDYYPFGMQINYGANHTNSLVNGRKHNYDFLGQERQEELGLNWLTFRHRNYIPEIGRFFGVDPISEEYHYITNYQFASNNPVWKIELEGLEGVETSGLEQIRAGFAKIWEAINPYSKVEVSNQSGLRKVNRRKNISKLSNGISNVARGAATKEAGHFALDVAGTADPTGIADGINAAWYGVEGDYTNASLSAISIIPYIGDALGKGGKATSWLIKSSTFSANVEKLDDIIMASFKNIKDLPDLEFIGKMTTTGKHLDLEVSIIPTEVMMGMKELTDSHKEFAGKFGKEIIKYKQSIQKWAKTQGFETIQFHGIRDTGVRKGQRQSTSVINLID